ncbi:MAG: DUF2933 domain-containing protein [Bacillota bacterium]
MSRKAMLWAGCGLMLLVGGYFLWSSGSGNWLAYGMLLLCPLMHLFMHGSHGHGGHSEHHAPGASRTEGESGSQAEKPACH